MFEISRKVQLRDILIRFRYLKMAKDIFVPRPGLGGSCCSAAAAAAAAASCTCGHGVLAQTNVSDASRVYYETERSNSHSYGAEAARSGQQSEEPHRAQCSAQRSSGDTALGWAWVADPNESLPLFLLENN